MSDETFTVTLPSNSNMVSDPTNRGSKYIVRLSAPINFGGQTLNDDVSWEAALTSLQYTNRFYSVREATTIHVVVQFPNVGVITVSVGALKGVRQYTDTLSANDIKAYAAIDQRILTQFVKATGSTDTSFVATVVIHLPAGHYSDPPSVYNEIVKEFNRVFGGTRFGTTMKAVIKGTDGTLDLQVEPATNKVFMFTEQASIVNTLGTTATAVDRLTPALYKIALTGTKTPRFDTVQSLYVYSDIVKPQHVGNTLAPLLEIIPVQGAPGQRMHYCFNPLTYLPVNRTFIEAISIEICDEYGNHVTFPDDVENVICRLRFRRSKHSALALL